MLRSFTSSAILVRVYTFLLSYAPSLLASFCVFFTLQLSFCFIVLSRTLLCPLFLDGSLLGRLTALSVNMKTDFFSFLNFSGFRCAFCFYEVIV